MVNHSFRLREDLFRPGAIVDGVPRERRQASRRVSTVFGARCYSIGDALDSVIRLVEREQILGCNLEEDFPELLDEYWDVLESSNIIYHAFRRSNQTLERLEGSFIESLHASALIFATHVNTALNLLDRRHAENFNNLRADFDIHVQASNSLRRLTVRLRHELLESELAAVAAINSLTRTQEALRELREIVGDKEQPKHNFVIGAT